MAPISAAKTHQKLRRIALNQQGLLKPNSFGRGKQATLRTIEQIGYVQIDTISVVERAHHHVLWSRVHNYQATFLDQLVKEKKVFEYWFHAAAYLPMRDYRFALPRMHAIRDGQEKHWAKGNPKLMREILKRIRDEGPLMARDFEDTRKTKNAWWDWKPAKHALDQLFMRGELMAAGRSGFQKIYDLPENVLPENIDLSIPTIDEYAKHLIDITLNSHGFATQKSFTYLRKGKHLREAIGRELAARIDAKELITLTLADSSMVYINPNVLESRSPTSQPRVRILSPFDNCVIQRERGRAIFDFDYQIECYVPEKKRVYGYFCLPILYHDTLVGRIDCKAHRKTGELEIKSLHIEKPVDEYFDELLEMAIDEFAGFNGCGFVKR